MFWEAKNGRRKTRRIDTAVQQIVRPVVTKLPQNPPPTEIKPTHTRQEREKNRIPYLDH